MKLGVINMDRIQEGSEVIYAHQGEIRAVGLGWTHMNRKTIQDDHDYSYTIMKYISETNLLLN